VPAASENDARASDCALCRGRRADPELFRVQVWEDALWRLTVTTEGEVLGLSYLEPKRHIPYVTDLDGDEARTFGPVLARAARALRDAADAELVYVYVFGGGIPHLHVHLAPHRAGDALSERFIRGEVTERRLPSGATVLASRDFPPLPPVRHARVRASLRRALAAPQASRLRTKPGRPRPGRRRSHRRAARARGARRR
jgi:diadenosine tetraphosphate (Ap4A) HIT family hydrolase